MQHPWRYLLGVLQKVFGFWYLAGSRAKTTLNLLTNIPLLVLAVSGFVLAAKRRKNFLPFLLPVFYFNGIHALLYLGSDRYFVPVVPYVTIFAAYTVWELVDRIRQRREAGLTGLALLG